ncbi:MAG: hypothetical protein EOS08_33080 [Mesorhizobium sp.]|nr:MAG: hypothetical protein EOS08_33080 [Mesorhizobium sp.]
MAEFHALILADLDGGEAPIIAPTIIGAPYPLTAAFPIAGDFSMIDFRAGADEDGRSRHVTIPQSCAELAGALRDAKILHRQIYFMVGPAVPGVVHSVTGEPVLFGRLCFLRKP